MDDSCDADEVFGMVDMIRDSSAGAPVGVVVVLVNAAGGMKAKCV